MNKSARHKDKSYGVALFHESMRAPIWVIAFLFFLMGSLSLAVWAAVGNLPTLLLSLIELLIIASYVRATTLEITVTKGWFLVGPAAIERAFVHRFEILDAPTMRRARGVELDPAAYLAIRYWVPTGIKAAIRDPKDPTPYWLVSSKRADELAKILNLAEH
ncbi:MAG: DUF3093 family protein [Actinobacteria bacterium]|uniref:Unannotated protein n=1 Tax=freshwater metagenome TaxID=449393 RepID=A0A6J7PNM0_9ZZZZ|nr:DUF3093 family protein [Actinomycetota bacterium]MSY81845.1 DUF3093 family protein [Actinomycetota bacterium]MSZ45286.1 DUF3093 family protein [Actinomycetota bacterium]MTA04045.1 DUF3093 family protein [Actinomycetota bacterium]MTA22589.1 DUF3093 family protein [Actinomycetota bacterium]